MNINRCKFLLFFLFSIIILSIPIQSQAYDDERIKFKEVYRWDEIFDYYIFDYAQKNNLNLEDVYFDCASIESELEVIESRIEHNDEKEDEATDIEKIKRYKETGNAYDKVERLYKKYKSSCLDDGGAEPPSINSHFITKQNKFNDIEIDIVNREHHLVRLKYRLDEGVDESMSVKFVITKEDLRYPYDISGMETYFLSLKDEEKRLYLQKSYPEYKDYYFYLIHNFNNTDNYFTTRPSFVQKIELNEFSDLDKSNKYYSAIRFLQEKNIINGFKDGSFGPEKSIKRKEFLKIAFESADYEMSLTSEVLPFLDIEDEDWALAYIRTAYKRNIITSDNEKFYPNKDISFLEAMKILSKIFKLEMPETMDEIEGLSEGHWGIKYVLYFKEKGFLDEDFTEYEKPLSREEGSNLVYELLQSSSL